jgi:hypothetical protein
MPVFTLKLCLLLMLTLSRTIVATRPSKVLTLSLMMKFRFESTVMLKVDPFAGCGYLGLAKGSITATLKISNLIIGDAEIPEIIRLALRNHVKIDALGLPGRLSA